MVHLTKPIVVASIFGCCVGGFLLLSHTTQVVPPVTDTTVMASSTPRVQVRGGSPVLPVYFTGDVMLARHVEILQRQGLLKPYDFIRLFASSTAVFTNFESAMSEPHIPTASGVMRFSTASSNLAVLESLSITHASLANNHSRDYGKEGYVRTVSHLRSLGITPFGDAVSVGTSSLTYAAVGSTTIAVIGLHTLFVPPDKAVLQALLTDAKASSDFQFIYIHWGDEYQTTHNQAQASLAEWLVNEGADAVIGHHPHVVQDISLINGVPVFYSLGNFIFDQYFSEDVQVGLVLGLEVTDTTLNWRLYPHSQCAKATPCLMDKKREASFLSGLANRSNEALYDQIMAKNIEIPR